MSKNIRSRHPQVPEGPRTEETLRNNVAVCIRYMAAWIGGTGCVPLYNLMEDAATAEISRAQVCVCVCVLWWWVGGWVGGWEGRCLGCIWACCLQSPCLAALRHSIADGSHDLCAPAPAQVWQWVRYGATLDGGKVCSAGELTLG